MAKAKETMADIIAEMRRYAHGATAHIRFYYTLDDAAESMREFAGRIEAAWKRECEASRAYWTKKCRDTITEHDRYCSPVGNAAAMRDALESVRNWCLNRLGNASYQVTVEGLLSVVNAALSVPARNCDLYDNWYDAHQAWERLPKDELGYFVAANGVHECEQAWLFSPAAERKGEGDGR